MTNNSKIEKFKEKTRNYLINELYEHLTPAKILYSSIKDLLKLRQELRFKKNNKIC